MSLYALLIVIAISLLAYAVAVHTGHARGDVIVLSLVAAILFLAAQLARY